MLSLKAVVSSLRVMASVFVCRFLGVSVMSSRYDDERR